MTNSNKLTSLSLSEDEIELLNSKIGLKNLFSEKKTNVEKALRMAKYEEELRELQAELIKLQQWVIDNNKRSLSFLKVEMLPEKVERFVELRLILILDIIVLSPCPNQLAKNKVSGISSDM